MTQRSCCVPGCLVKLGDGVLLHRFPNPSNPAQIERFRTWIMRIGGDIVREDNAYIYRNRKVCHRHFQEEYIFPSMKLSALAIPSLYISGAETGLHKFPNPDKQKELFNTWLYAVGGDVPKLENSHIFKYRRVCQNHFEEKYWCRNKRLSNIAVPTKNMPGLSLGKFSSQESLTTTMKSMQTSQASTLEAQHSPQGLIIRS